MRPSPLRHPLAVLRQIIGISQKELANLVGKSTATIQSIELGKLNLSEELAMKISLETGVSVKWLLAGNPNVEPFFDDRPVFSGEGQKYSKAVFEWRRGERAEGREGWAKGIHFAGLSGAQLNAIEAAAIENPDWPIARYRIWKFLKLLEEEFGISKDEYDREMEKMRLWSDFQLLFEPPYEDAAANNPRELVSALNKSRKDLERIARQRREKGEFADPGILPLLRWVWKALDVCGVTPARPAGSKKSRA